MLARQSLLWVFHLLPSGPQGCVSEARRNTEAAATAHRPAPHQDFSNKLHGTLRHMRPVLLLKRETARLDLVEQLVLVVARERRVAAQQDVEDDAQAPAVHGSIVRLALKDLGGDVPVGHKGAGARSHTHKVVSGRPLSVAQLAGDNPPWRAACGVQRATRFVDVLRKPEVRNLTHHSVTHVSTRPSHAHTPNTVHHTPSAQRRHGLSTAGCSQAVAETPGGNVRQWATKRVRIKRATLRRSQSSSWSWRHASGWCSTHLQVPVDDVVAVAVRHGVSERAHEDLGLCLGVKLLE